MTRVKGQYLENPLDKFQSYSVHYLMLACRTTEAADVFATANDDKNASASLEAITRTKNLGDQVIIQGNPKVKDVYLVLDTRRFSQFTVENVKYDVYINGLQTGASTSNLATELQMTILDSVGISFANFMQWLLSEQMKTNFDGLIFMLRIIFVGHNADGTSVTVQSETIPMILTRMDINLDYAKGAYSLDFLPNMNFKASKLQRYMTISTATQCKTSGAGNTLGSAIEDFEKTLNTASTAYYFKIQEILGVKPGDKMKGRLVKYMITLPDGKKGESWADFPMSGPSIGSAEELKFPKVGSASAEVKDEKTGVISNVFVTADAGRNITDVIDKILSQVPRIAELGNFKSKEVNDQNAKVTFYKQIVGISSDDDLIIVHVDIVEFEVYNVFAARGANAKAQITGNADNLYNEVKEEGSNIVRRVPKDFFEYDFIFTGKNKDILNFDLKLQDFQMLLAGNLKIGDSAAKAAADDGGDIPPDVLAKIDELIAIREYDPLPIPFSSKNALINFSNYGKAFYKPKDVAKTEIENSQKYTSNLSKFYASCATSAAITIKGNPAIMHKFNIGRSQPHVKVGDQTISPYVDSSKKRTPNAVTNFQGAKKAYRAALEKNILKSNPTFEKAASGSFAVKASPLSEKCYAVSPVYIRINVKGPNVDFRTNTLLGDDMTTSDVLTDNYYTVFKVTNNISGHNFTQELELYVHNIFGTTKNKKENS